VKKFPPRFWARC